MVDKEIQLFSPYYRSEECLDEIRECLESGWTGLGYKTITFEKNWCTYTGLSYAHFISSATAGLHLAVKLLKEKHNWQSGDEIITTPLTFVSTNHSILYEHLQPIFADVDEYLCLDPDSVRQKISKKTKAVMFVGLGGNSGQLIEVADICREYGLSLILDAAHMAGTKLFDRHIGSEADVSVFSFHSVKNLPTADGGMICFKDKELDKLVREWTWLGITKDTYQRTSSDSLYKWRYDVENVGFKYHGNSVMAALGIVALRYLESDNDYRKQIAAWYDELIDSSVERVRIAPNCDSSRHLYQILSDKRDELLIALNRQRIYPGVHYTDNTQYRMYAYAKNSCPRATLSCERLLSLPIHLKLTYEDVKRISLAINEFQSHNNIVEVPYRTGLNTNGQTRQQIEA